jgi:hypothetical protein
MAEIHDDVTAEKAAHEMDYRHWTARRYKQERRSPGAWRRSRDDMPTV